MADVFGNRGGETKLKGDWWVPDRPERKIQGDLTVGKAAGATLELFDHFLQKTSTRPLWDAFTIWGTILSGRPATLFYCHTRNINYSLAGGGAAIIRSPLCILGGHFAAPDEVLFSTVIATLNGIQAWACTTGMKLEARIQPKELRLTALPLNPIHLGTHHGRNIVLEFTYQGSRPRTGKLVVEETCTTVIRSETPVTLSEFVKSIGHVQYFVALGLNHAIHVGTLIGRVAEPKYIVGDTPRFENYEIIRPLGNLSDDEDSEDMLFSLQDLQPTPSLLFQKYLDIAPRLAAVTELYCSPLYFPEMHPRQRFLTLAHAVEAYHRGFVGGQYQPDNEYREGLQRRLWEAVPSSLPADFKASLKKKLEYLHEFSLRKRIKDLASIGESYLADLIGSPEAFSAAVSDLRNSLTHPDASVPGGIGSDSCQLWLLSEQLSLLIESCILRELGFDESLLRSKICSSPRAERIQLNRQV